LALENGALGFLNALAASAWLALQLVNVTRWLLAHSDGDLPDAIEEIDPQCFELRQKIHHHVAFERTGTMRGRFRRPSDASYPT
jgi:hypothetical protein